MAVIKSLGARVPQTFETGIIANLVAGAVIGLLARLAMTLLTLMDSSFKLNDSNLYVGIPLFSFLNFGYGFLLGLAIQFLNKHAIAIDGVNRWVRWGILAVILAALVWLFIWSDAIAFNR